MSKWLEAITAARRAAVEKPPPGWQTRKEIGREMGVQLAQAGRTITALVESGLAERRDFMIQCGSLTRKVPHYRLRGKR